MMSCRSAIHRIAFALSIAAAALAAGPVRADSLFGDAPAGEVLPIDSSASQAARLELNRARIMLTRARLAVGRTQRAAELQLRKTSGYGSLQINAAQAVSAYHAAKRPALSSLQRDREYAQLARQREALRAEIRRIADQKKVDAPEILPLANRALATGQRMTRAESIVLAIDPSVEDARAEMTDAFAALRHVTVTARAKAAEFPAVTMAREDVAIARERVSMANANLAAALRAEAAAERSRDRRYGRQRGA